MNYNRKPSYFIIVITVLCLLFIPRHINSKYIFIFILTAFLTLRKHNFIIHKFPIGMSVYFATRICSYVINYENNSILNIFNFIVTFLFVREIVLKIIKKSSDFKSVIKIISYIFLIYSLLCILESISGINIFDTIFNRNISISGGNGYRYGILRSHGACTMSINNGIILVMGLSIVSYYLFNYASSAIFKLTYVCLWISIILNLSRMVVFIAVLSQIIIAIKCGFAWLIKRILLFLTIIIIGLFISENGIKNVVDLFNSFFGPIFNTDLINAASNLGGIGNRLELWSVVFDRVKDSIIFGNGFDASLNYAVEYSMGGGYWIKDSIEVHWLSTLFQTGLFGLIGFISYQLYCLKSTYKNRNYIVDEKIFSFNYLAFILSIFYFISLFTVSGFEDLIFYYFVFNLFEAYNRIVHEVNLKRR